MNPLFSIVVCTKNNGDTITDTLESIRSQSVKDVEVVIVDGNSKDQTLKIVDEVCPHHTLVRDADRGVADAMSRGAKASSGSIINFLNADDYYLHPNVLSLVERSLPSSSLEWIFGRIINRRGRDLFAEPFVAPQYSYSQLLHGNFIPTPATFIKRSVFDRFGYFDSTLKFAMDYDYWLRIGKDLQPVQISSVLAVFRRHEGSLTTRFRTETLLEDYAVRKRYIEGPAVNRWPHLVRLAVRRRRLDALGKSDSRTE